MSEPKLKAIVSVSEDLPPVRFHDNGSAAIVRYPNGVTETIELADNCSSCGQKLAWKKDPYGSPWAECACGAMHFFGLYESKMCYMISRPRLDA